MLFRERRREIAAQVYQAQLVGAGLRIPSGLFALWTQAFEDEVNHENYKPGVIEEKRSALKALTSRHDDQLRQIKKVQAFEIRSQKDLLPYTKEEREARLARLRKKELAKASGGWK